MKKLIMVLFVFMFNQTINAQNGVVSINNIDDDLPVGQWFVVKDVVFNDNSFFYDKTSIVMDELEYMLTFNGQTFFSPMGSDDDLDPYWIISKKSGFTTEIYLIRGKDGDEYSSLRTITY
jgi:hypothetical protein